ncbi:hypothetical protein PP410_gp70 [Vibrio phage NF]|uniref:Uncharacterized protein n=1 Tax=Vibrio phage NF TaxID=2686202 RepID=A0A6B9J048_9CAUD|nr:hypothetical protein PP410_gp70 [Vibrio phage NF]QGZ13287.1 hypothetical protein [Vibrio phage NF]
MSKRKSNKRVKQMICDVLVSSSKLSKVRYGYYRVKFCNVRGDFVQSINYGRFHFFNSGRYVSLTASELRG